MLVFLIVIFIIGFAVGFYAGKNLKITINKKK